MSSTTDEYVPVRSDVLAKLQASAALGSKVSHAREIVVTEAKAAPSVVRSIAAPIGVGAILGYIATFDDVKNNETVKKHWWLLPSALLLVGYILKRKNSPHASTVLTAGAVLFVQAYQNRPKKDEEKKADAPAQNKARAGGDTGAPVPTLHPIDDRTAWIQSNGQWIRVQLAAPIRQALPQQTAPSAAVPPANDPAAALAAAAFAA